jgi:hypothetical protein
MALRKPLYWTGTALQEMSTADISSCVSRAVWEYKNNPSVTLSVVNNGGNLGSISDTRRTAGTALIVAESGTPTEADTEEPGTVTVNYDRIEQTIASITAPTDSGSSYPLYWNGSSLQAMTFQDMIDTFITDAVSTISSSNSLYTLNTSTTLTNYTSVSATPVFVDTRADTSLYTNDGLAEAVDQPTTITEYYLMRSDAGTATIPSQIPVMWNGSAMQNYSPTAFYSLLEDAIRYAVTAITGSKITFNWDGAGNNSGSYTNTVLDGTGNFQVTYGYVFGLGNQYTAQEFPNGSPVSNAGFLRVQLT